MFWIALAAQITAPAPDSPSRWFSGNDVPQYLIKRNSGLWLVPVRVSVAPDGKIRGCEAEAVGQVPSLDDYTCGIIQHRAKFRPAEIDGIPTFGVYRTSVMYVVADVPLDTSKVSNPDIDVSLKRLPAGLDSPTLVKVAFTVDASGQKSSCTADGSAGLERVNNHPDLVAVACNQIMEGYRATPAAVAGQPIASVQNALVRFSAAPSK